MSASPVGMSRNDTRAKHHCPSFQTHVLSAKSSLGPLSESSSCDAPADCFNSRLTDGINNGAPNAETAFLKAAAQKSLP